MKATDFRDKESQLTNEVEKAIKGVLETLGRREINLGTHELNCPCINSGVPEHALHTVGSVTLNKGQINFDIDDQQGGYNCSEIPLDSAIELLSQIEDLDESDFE